MKINSFGRFLEVCLASTTKTRREIADDIEMDISIICHWVKGTRKPKGVALVNLADSIEIGVELRDLLYRHRSPAAWQTMAQKTKADRVALLESAYRLAALL